MAYFAQRWLFSTNRKDIIMHKTFKRVATLCEHPVIEKAHLDAAFQLVGFCCGDPYVVARIRCSLILLFLTGLKTYEIRYCRVGTVKSLLKTGALGCGGALKRPVLSKVGRE